MIPQGEDERFPWLAWTEAIFPVLSKSRKLLTRSERSQEASKSLRSTTISVRLHGSAHAQQPQPPMVSFKQAPVYLPQVYTTCLLIITVFPNRPLHTPTHRLLPTGSPDEPGDERQRQLVGTNPFRLTFKHYITGNPANSLF
jgi:hypothetical protein